MASNRFKVGPKALFRVLSLMLVWTLMGSSMALAAESFSTQSETSARSITVSKVEGSVTMTRSGGVKSVQVFKGMKLYEGDMIVTADTDASAILENEEHELALTLDRRTALYITKLDGNERSGFTTLLELGKGTVYTKVGRKLRGVDRFEVITPTSVMDVKGTNFVVSVQPSFGDTSVFVLSGVLQAALLPSPTLSTIPTLPSLPTIPTLPSLPTIPTIPTLPSIPPLLDAAGLPDLSDLSSIFVFPTMQANLIPGGLGSGIPILSTLGIIDPFSFTNSAGPAVIQALIAYNAQAELERQSLIELLQQGPPAELLQLLGLASPQGLIDLQENMNNLTSVLVNQAVNSGIVDQQQIQDIIDKANQATQSDIKLGGQEQLVLTPDQQAALEAQRGLEKQRREQQQQQQQERKRQQQNLDRVLSQIQDAMNQLNQQNRDAQARKSEEALERYKQSLTEEQREQLEQRREDAGISQSPTPSPPPATVPSGNSGGDPEDNDEPEETDTTPPSDASIAIEDGAEYANQPNVTLFLHAAGATQVRATEEGDNGADTGWVDYSPQLEFTLSDGDGMKTVSVQYRDQAGNVAGTVSDQITLDTTLPVLSLKSPAATTVTTNVYAQEISFSAEPGATVSVTQGDVLLFEDVSEDLDQPIRYTITGMSEGTNAYIIRAVDAAGNAQSIDLTFNVDVTPPKVEIIGLGDWEADADLRPLLLKAEEGAAIKVYENDVEIGRGTGLGMEEQLSIRLNEAIHDQVLTILVSDDLGNEATIHWQNEDNT